MDKEDIIEIIRKEVVEKFGEKQIKDIIAFGPFEGEDLNVMVIVEGVDRKSKEALEVASKIRHKLWDLDLDVPFGISKAEES
ncbi:MAG: hypothetical protein ACE5J9_10545 [Methanosarcinales archaeon]